jgi:hypothetical protein
LIHEAYIAARGMEKDGVAAITSNCGFTARFQKDVAASVSIPVASPPARAEHGAPRATG